MAIVVPWIEVVAGLCVLAGFWLRSGALIITAMTAVFFFVITSALARGLNIECGCFGTVGGKTIGLHNLAIDLVFLSPFSAADVADESGRSPAQQWGVSVKRR